MGALATLLLVVTASASAYAPPRLEDGRPDLEVETRNFMPDQNRAGDFLISSQTVIVERFALTAHDELNYKFTISEPQHYTRPWTGETQYLRSEEPIFEDACHEGNYSLKHILEGGRVRDGTLR